MPGVAFSVHPTLRNLASGIAHDASVSNPQSAPPRVLVVEQDTSQAFVWRDAIVMLGALVTTVADPSTALACEGAALVVLGSLPHGACPVALSRALASRPFSSRPRVIVISRGPLRRIDRVHVDVALERPLRTEALVAHVRRLLDLSGSRRALRGSPEAR